MALDAGYDAPKKDLYEVGEIPPMGHVPEQMYAWTIRRDRHGGCLGGAWRSDQPV